jgi:hypothetical protein
VLALLKKKMRAIGRTISIDRMARRWAVSRSGRAAGGGFLPAKPGGDGGSGISAWANQTKPMAQTAQIVSHFAISTITTLLTEPTAATRVRPTVISIPITAEPPLAVK